MPGMFADQFRVAQPYTPDRLATGNIQVGATLPRKPPTEDPTEEPTPTGGSKGDGKGGSIAAGAKAGASSGASAGSAAAKMSAVAGLPAAAMAAALGHGATAGASVPSPEWGISSAPAPDIFHKPTTGATVPAKTGSPGILGRLEEPFNPSSGLNQGFKHNVDAAANTVGHGLAAVGHDLGNWGYDAFSPNASWRNSGWSQDLSKVMNFGNPFPAGSPGGPPKVVSPRQFSGVQESSVPSAVGAPEGGISGFANSVVHAGETVGEKALSFLGDAADAL